MPAVARAAAREKGVKSEQPCCVVQMFPAKETIIVPLRYCVCDAALPLLVRPACAQVHWLRIILDEGHMLGASLAETNRMQVACALHADRRWVMTGGCTRATQI